MNGSIRRREKGPPIMRYFMDVIRERDPRFYILVEPPKKLSFLIRTP